MAKIDCFKCGIKRGRRECPKYNNRYICGDCCSSIQLYDDCPKDCIHIGKLSKKDIRNRTQNLIDMGIKLREENPDESIELFNDTLKIDKNNTRALIEKGITYGSLNDFEKEIFYIKEAIKTDTEDNEDTLYRLADAYRRAGKYEDAIDIVYKNEKLNDYKSKYILGESYFMLKKYKESEQIMKDIAYDKKASDRYKDMSKIILSKTHMIYKDFDKAIEIAEQLSKDSKKQKDEIIEESYFISGRMYELLNYIDSLASIYFREKYLLLQCATVLKKNKNGNLILIIDDLLRNKELAEDSFERIGLYGLKIKLLFKELNIEKALEIFNKHKNSIISEADRISDCYEACSMIAYFLYGIEKKESIDIYETITGASIDGMVIDEMFTAFSTMDLHPYIRAKAIAKSINIVGKGEFDKFNRNLIAADILFNEGDYEQAANLYKRIYDIEKPDDYISNRLATCLMKQSIYNEALDTFSNISEKGKLKYNVYSKIIMCSLELNINLEGIFEKVNMDSLSFNETYELAECLISNGHDYRALYIYNYMLDRFAKMDIYSRKMIYHNMARAYRELNYSSKAIEAIEHIPDEFMGETLTIDLGCLYLDLNEIEKAKNEFTKATEKFDSIIAYYNIGVAEIKDKNFDGAYKEFNTTLNILIKKVTNKNLANRKEYENLFNSIYKNMSICLLNMGKSKQALLYIEKAILIKNDSKNQDTLDYIQKIILAEEKGEKTDLEESSLYVDETIIIDKEFTYEIRWLVDDIIMKIYGQTESKAETNILNENEKNIKNFLLNERSIYSKSKESIERTEGTFKRYVDNFISSFDKKVLKNIEYEDYNTVLIEEAAPAIDKEGNGKSNHKANEVERLISVGDYLFESFEYVHPQEYVYTALLPYFMAVKILSRNKIYPYFKKSQKSLPLPNSEDEFRDIGIYSYKTNNKPYYRIDFSYDISSSLYLQDINYHPGIRRKYINYEKHYMPWTKLTWIISGIRRGWDVVDDIKSAGLLLLFYSGFKNHLGIEGRFKEHDDIIRLAGDLIQLNNERDYLIKAILNDEFEYDFINNANQIRDLALRSIEGLKKIK
jgi:lipopolysaccharide biosynthesis regulator YciM